MAIQFNPNALSRFANVDFRQNDAIANLGEGDGLVQNGNRGLGVFAKIRFKSTKANNNAVRTELLKALGQAFDLGGVSEVGGKTMFSAEFMDRLEDILGPAFKRDDFGINADGEVKSGKPLTQHRITAIVNAARAKGEVKTYNGKIYRAKVDDITNWFNTKCSSDSPTTKPGLDFFGDLRRTIEFLENDLDGITTVEGIDNFVFEKTGMRIDNIGGIKDQNVLKIKNHVKERLEALVKQSVDIFIKAREYGETRPFVDDVINLGDRDVEETLRRLEWFGKRLP